MWEKREIRTETQKEATGEHKNSLSSLVKLSTYLVGIHLSRILRICH